MKKISILLLLTIPMPAIAADAPPVQLPDPVTIKVSRQVLQVIGQGLYELPMKTAAPILNDLQTQLNAADKAAQDAAKPEPSPSPSPGGPPVAPPAEPAQK